MRFVSITEGYVSMYVPRRGMKLDMPPRSPCPQMGMRIACCRIPADGEVHCRLRKQGAGAPFPLDHSLCISFIYLAHNYNHGWAGLTLGCSSAIIVEDSIRNISVKAIPNAMRLHSLRRIE